MALQLRRGAYEDFDPDKMVAAEVAVVTEGDPNSASGRSLYICFEPGVVKRLADYEDILDLFEDAEDEALQEAIARLEESVETIVDHVEDIQEDVDAKAVLSQSYAKGGTGTRTGEDTDNAKYYMEQAAEIVGFTPESTYPFLTAGQLLSTHETTDNTPYNFRTVEQESTLEYGDIIGGTVAWNQLCNASSVTVQNGHKYFAVKSGTASVGASDGTAITGLTSGTDIVTDLTQMLGTTLADYIYSLESATAGAGVEWLKKHFPKMFTYHAYDAGSLQSVEGLSHHVTMGFNQFNTTLVQGSISGTGVDTVSYTRLRSGFIHVLPSTEYYIMTHGLPNNFLIFEVHMYDADQNWMNYSGVSRTSWSFTTSANCHYIKVLIRKSDNSVITPTECPESAICLNVSSDRNGEYEPCNSHTYPLDSTKTFRGIYKLDSSNRLYADGDVYKPDGKVERRYGVVDLGTLSWSYVSASEVYFFKAALDGKSSTLNIIGTSYAIRDYAGILSNDKSLCIVSDTVRIRDSAYTDAATFKTAMSGVYLVYELATPTTETADPYTDPQIVAPGGTEEYISTSVVPVGHESRYPDDLRTKLDDLPRNLSMIAPIENGTTASQAYAVGKYFMHNNQFCKAKTAIASGATLTLNTNYEVTTVANELYSALH